MLTNDERVTLEVLDIVDAGGLRKLANVFADRIREVQLTTAFSDECQRAMDYIDDDTGQLKPAGRAELNRLRAKAKESEVGDE